ncbi:pantothenate kinase [Mycolicibacterium conceptionense]|uniref:Type III pantothenate kinase n=1 Tax=Mycolicibacterium conceptionense TaxID=451644 RepID=A0A0U1DVH6_9MYCO|nr:pantothenate kinase [Mycolicibacterium conceptionense]
MLLAIDVRNTHTIVGLISGSGDHAKVVQQWRIRTEAEVTADELALTIDGLIGEDSERLTGAAGLSTVPSVLHEVRLMLEQYWPAVPHVLIEPGVRTGIPLLVDNPKEVGADRIVNCLAAYHKYGTAAIIVDFGSSICVDVVSAKGEFLGGAIAPGVQVSSDAAAARSAALRRVELTRPRSVIGKNTVECMQAGAVFASPDWSTDWSAGSAKTSTGSPAVMSRWWRPVTPPRWCCLICGRSSTTTATSRSTGCAWCSNATATVSEDGSSRPGEAV